MTEGRIGWNCVTGSNDGAAQNYGHEKHRPHDERYDVADEFADVVTRLWEAWEPDAVVLDRENRCSPTAAKVHPIHHEGKYFKVRGPINAPRSPQGRVPICQAGGSPRGQAVRRRAGPTRSSPKAAAASRAMKAYRDERPRARQGARPQSRRHQGAVPRPSDRRHHDGGGARTPAAARRRPPRRTRHAALEHVAPDRHRLRASSTSTSRCPRTSPPTATSPRSPSGSARRRARWCAATPARAASIHRHARPRRRHDAGDHAGGRRRRLPDLQQLLRPPLRHGDLRRPGARAAAPRPDAQGLRPQAPAGTICWSSECPWRSDPFHLAWFLSQGIGPKSWRSLGPAADVRALDDARHVHRPRQGDGARRASTT